MKLWQRYFLTETLRILILFVVCFFLLYVLIDYSVHSKALAHAHISLSQIASYYGGQFSKRLEMLLPFALMVASIKVLTSMNQRNELVALLAAGTPIYKLMVPFLFLATLALGCLYANFEWVYPRAVSFVDGFDDTYLRHVRKNKQGSLQALRLLDHSHVVYGSHDASSESIRDAYWLRGAGDIYHIGTLYPHAAPPLACDVEILKRSDEGRFEVVGSFSRVSLDDMQVDPSDLSAAMAAPQVLAISTLFQRIPKRSHPFSDNEAAIVTNFYSKLALPFLCLLVVMGPAPAALRFGRHLPVFLIYCMGIVGFLAFFATMKAAIILGEHQVVRPALAVWVPVLLALGATGWRFARLPGS